ncbi:hypothetical protein CONPUDRAFT_127435 [Coniophora puteana RWD-64-598 SS2]|uniref:Uncharacterized protein n=1 Tax=Coniophora puteana (strain RWD-64-598) TaxID=741705 RepID=A0A5M3MKL6_CONPW|nr:uncharacterized protein CONPUDRAFT_127435 [Coniophora puteana RWD-64-598 SS2]EIW79364.1 hypothetical protein CONPUDRAFT_127435 [Coniophora puteana RWD-64-598 SS2]
MRCASSRASEYEVRIGELSGRLSEQLSSLRAVDSLVHDALTSIQRQTLRANRARSVDVPHIRSELDRSLRSLQSLAHTLPTVQTQIGDIRHVYDSGREKAQTLVADLEWLNTDFPARWRTILFTSRAPVSWRWKAMSRAIFVLVLVLACVVACVALRGAYRAHRQRLVWGERLMS